MKLNKKNSFALSAVMSIFLAQNCYAQELVSCVSSKFLDNSTTNWHNITLKLTNNCNQDLDFTNTKIQFLNKTNLNTDFWGEFAPLSYPDNQLKITSTANSGSFLSSLMFHLPEDTWAKRILPKNQSIILSFGAATADYDPNSVQVYLNKGPAGGGGGTVPVQGMIKIQIPSLPTELSSYSANPSIVATKSGTTTTVSNSFAWNTLGTINNLEANVSYALTTPVITTATAKCTGSLNPATIQSNATAPLTATLSYSCTPITLPPTAGKGKVVAAYIPGWKTPPPASELAKAGYTHVFIAFGVFSKTSPGAIVPAFETISKDYINQLHAAGIKAILSLGGASTSIANTSVDFHQVLSLASSPTAFQNTFVQSAKNLIAQYGFDGIDIDIEHGLNGSGTFANPTGDIRVMADILNTLHQQSPALLLTLTPQVANISATSGFDGTWGNYAALAMQTYNSLSWVGVQIYNTGCAYGINQVCYADEANSPDLSVAMAVALLENWPQKTASGSITGFQPYISYLQPSKVVLGYPAPNAQGVSDGLPAKSTTVIKRAIQCLRTGVVSAQSCDKYVPPRTYPDIAGVFEWEVTYDQNNGYRFAELKNCVIDGNCA